MNSVMERTLILGLGDNAVGEFVENDRSEEQQSGEDTNGPGLRACPRGILRREIAGYGKRDQAKNKNPAEINVDGYAEYASDANPLCLRHLFHRTAIQSRQYSFGNPCS